MKINVSWRKKVLSLVLCVAVMLSVMVLGAGAAFSDQDQIENTEAVDACSALNIIGGYEDGSFHPERNIKRSEITKMICVALNGGKDPNVGTNEIPTFTDVRGTADAWAEGYIEACVAQGIVSGVGGGRFAPAGNVTGAQLAKMLLVALGYDAGIEEFTGNAWETNVNVRASQKHLYDGLEDLDTSVAVTRDQAAQMVWNAMQAYEVEYKTTIITDENGNLITQNVAVDKVVESNHDKISLLTDKYKAYINVGTLTTIDGKSMDILMSDSDKVDSDIPETDHFLDLKTDYSDLLGQKVKVMFTKQNNVMGVYATNENTVVTANQNAIDVDAGKIVIGDNSYAIDTDGVVVVKDGQQQANNWKAGNFKNAQSADVISLIDTDQDSKIDTAYIKTVDVQKVTYVSASQIIAGSKTYKFADDTIPEGVAKDDWVIITKDLYNDNNLLTVADKATGAVEATKKASAGYNQYQIDGTWYNEAPTNSGKDINTNVKPGVNAEYVAVNGILFYAAKTSAGADQLTDVLFVAYVGQDGLTNDQAKVMFPNGDKATITLKNAYSTTQAGAKGDTIVPGQFYEYSKSGNTYELIDLSTDADFYGNFTYEGKLDLNGTAEQVSSDKIADTADVIVWTSNEAGTTVDYKHITGKQLKALVPDTLKVDGSDNNLNATTRGYFTSDVDGLNRASVIAVEYNGNGTLGTAFDNISSNANYGFITKDAVKLANGKIKFTVWTGKENLEVIAEKSNEEQFTAGTIVGYTAIEEQSDVSAKADGSTYVMTDAVALTAEKGLVSAGSITGVNSAGTKIEANIPLDKNDLSDYSTVLYVDSKAGTGLTDGKAVKANSQEVNDETYYATNLLVYGTEVIVIDVNEIAGSTYSAIELPKPDDFAGLTDVQWLNTRTNDTDEGAAYAGAVMQLSFYAESDGKLTLTNVADIEGNDNDGMIVLEYKAGYNKFDSLIITGKGEVIVNGDAPEVTDKAIASVKVTMPALTEGKELPEAESETANVTTATKWNATGNVVAGETYTATVTLTAADGYKFTKDTTVTAGANGTVTAPTADTKTITVTYKIEVKDDGSTDPDVPGVTSSMTFTFNKNLSTGSLVGNDESESEAAALQANKIFTVRKVAFEGDVPTVATVKDELVNYMTTQGYSLVNKNAQGASGEVCYTFSRDAQYAANGKAYVAISVSMTTNPDGTLGSDLQTKVVTATTAKDVKDQIANASVTGIDKVIVGADMTLSENSYTMGSVTLEVAAGKTLTVKTVANLGTITGEGNVVVDAAATSEINVGGTVTVNKGASTTKKITADGDITINGTANTDNMPIVSNEGNIVINGTAGSTTSGAITATKGSVTVNRDATAAGNITAGTTVTIAKGATATGDIAAGTTVTIAKGATADVAISAKGDITIAGSANGSAKTITSDEGNIVIDGTAGQGAIKATKGSVTVNGTANGAITAGNGVVIGEDGTVAKDLAITATAGDIVINGEIETVTSAALDITATKGNITVGQYATIAGKDGTNTLNLKAAEGTVTVNGDASSNVAISAKDVVLNAGAATAGIDATGTLTVAGNATVEGAVTLKTFAQTAGTTLTLSGTSASMTLPANTVIDGNITVASGATTANTLVIGAGSTLKGVLTVADNTTAGILKLNGLLKGETGAKVDLSAVSTASNASAGVKDNFFGTAGSIAAAGDIGGATYKWSANAGVAGDGSAIAGWAVVE